MKDDERELFTHLLKTKLPQVDIHNLFDVSVLSDGLVFRGMSVYKQLLLSNDQGYLNVPTWKGLFRIYISYNKQVLSKNVPYALIHNCFSHTYYHWLLEVLPRLFLIKDTLDVVTLLLPANHNLPFHQDSLDIFGVKWVHQINEKCVYKVHKLIVPSQIGRMANYHPEMITATVSYVKRNTCLNLNLGDKIYISRSKASRRKVLNEDEVVDFLKSLDFTVIHFEDYTFSEQVSIMHHCRYLVSIHGAGLSNMIFMNEAGSVLELRKYDKGENYFFFTLASTACLNYYYQFCNSPEEQSKVQDADIWVNMALLHKNLELMLAV